jgi:deazaflavin-dependent oxidoreductase (nitroreductase family)
MNQFPDTFKTAPKQPPVRVFPAEGTNLARILSDSQFRQVFHTRLKRYNPLMVVFYRVGLLPLFGASRTVMLLTTKGKKSGKARSTPIGYFRIGGSIYLFSAWGKKTAWYKNMQANPNDVWIQIGFHRQHVFAQALEDPAEIQQLLECFITESPDHAKYLFGWDPACDRMEYSDFSKVRDQVLIIRFVGKEP